MTFSQHTYNNGKTAVELEGVQLSWSQCNTLAEWLIDQPDCESAAVALCEAAEEFATIPKSEQRRRDAEAKAAAAVEAASGQSEREAELEAEIAEMRANYEKLSAMLAKVEAAEEPAPKPAKKTPAKRKPAAKKQANPAAKSRAARLREIREKNAK